MRLFILPLYLTKEHFQALLLSRVLVAVVLHTKNYLLLKKMSFHNNYESLTAQNTDNSDSGICNYQQTGDWINFSDYYP